MRKNTTRRKIKLFRRQLMESVVQCVVKIIGLVPYDVLRLLVSVFAPVLFVLLRKDRKRMMNNLCLAFPEKSRTFRKSVAFGVLPNIGRACVDLLDVQRSVVSGKKSNVPIKVDWDREFEFFFEKGGIAVTGHLGAWEIVGGLTAQQYPGKVAVIAKRVYLSQVDEWIVNFRQSLGMRVLYHDESPRVSLRFLREKNLLGILPDQDIKRMAGIFLPFFGRQAWTLIGPAMLAVAAKVPIKAFYLVWDRGCYRMKSGEAIFPPEGVSREEQIRQLTLNWTRVLEDSIRQFPDQWVWFHRRWRTRPETIERLKRSRRS